MDAERSFGTTIWELVDGAKADPEQLRTVVAAYYPALRTYLTRAFKLPDGRLEDWLHDFLIQTNWLGTLVNRAERGRGKFRALLATAARNFVLDRLRRGSPAGPMPDGFDPADSVVEIEAPRFEAAWAESVLGQAIGSLYEECAAAPNRAQVWNVFKARYLEPNPWDGATIAGEFKLTKGQVDAAARQARIAFRRLALALLERQTTNAQEQDEAFADLFQIVRGYDRLGTWRRTQLPYLKLDTGDTAPSLLLAAPTADESDLRVGELLAHAMAERVLEQFESDWRASAPGGPALRVLLAAPAPDLDELNRLKAFAKLRRTTGTEGEVWREAATWLYYAALAVAWHRLKARITTIPDQQFAQGLRWSASRGWGWPEVDAVMEAVVAELR